MAKHAKKPAAHNAEEDTTGIVSEPVAVYGLMQDPVATRTIGLMGMQSKRGFAAIQNDNDFISVIRSGIPRQAMTHLMEIADISLTEMASITHTSDRTLRRYTPQQKLSEGQSERIVEIARLYVRGEEVFGTIELFNQWMNSILLAFGNKKPKEFLDTSIGIGMITDELGRIEHGILA